MVEDKLEQITTAFVSLQQIMLKKGFIAEEDDPGNETPTKLPTNSSAASVTPAAFKFMSR